MAKRLLDRLPPWLVGSLLLLGIIALAVAMLPSVECGEGSRDESAEVLVLAATAVAVIVAVGAGLFRLVAMALAGRYGKRDGWIFSAALFVLAASAVAGSVNHNALGGLALGGVVLALIAFIALLLAAFRGLTADAVGVLLPTFLFGAAWIYLLVGVIALIAKSGIGC